mmetsp:Transcript_2420/g.6502  ORF Transcript_2420/g.6502 Transcript_2420/m.6502 type:complete len:93 (+) Transcript_2420:1560-1838(+)
MAEAVDVGHFRLASGEGLGGTDHLGVESTTAGEQVQDVGDHVPFRGALVGSSSGKVVDGGGSGAGDKSGGGGSGGDNSEEDRSGRKFHGGSG